MATDIELPVWSFRANWRDGVTERLEFLTDVLRGAEGAEQRRSLRPTPRRTVEADFLLSGPERTFYDLFTNRLGGGEMMVPLYWDVASITSAIPAGATTRIDFDNTLREFIPGLAILTGKTALDYEVVEIVSIDALGVEIADETARSWPVGSKIIPLRRALIDEQGTPSHATAGMAAFSARFLLLDGNDWWPAVPLPKHSGGWKYLLEPWDTEDSDYSAVDFDDSGWDIGHAPFYRRGPPHYFPGVTEWGGYGVGTDILVSQDIWLRRTFQVAPGYDLRIDLAFDNTARLWIDGEEVTLTSTGSGLATATLTNLTNTNPSICIFVDELDVDGGSNYTFADVQVSQVLAGAQPVQLYQGRPVFLDEPNWVDSLEVAMDRDTIRLDNNLSLPYQVDATGRATLGQSHRWFLPGRQRLAEFRDLIYRHKGRVGSFWLPTFKHDLRLVNSPGSGATQIIVENVGYGYTGGPTSGREYIAIKHAGGTILRKVTSVLPGTTPATERLNLDAPLGLALSPGQVRRISFADVARFDQDDYEITHHGGIDNLHESQGVFRTFKATRTAPDPISHPIPDSFMSPSPCGVDSPQILVPRHSPGWKYLLEPYTTVGSDYSNPGFNDAGWATGHAPFYHRTGSPIGGIVAWGGYDVGTAFSPPQDVWMRRRFSCLSGYTLRIDAAFDNLIEVWINGVPVTITGSFIGRGEIVAPSSSVVIAIRVDELNPTGGSNWTFADVEVTQLPPGYEG